MDSPQLHVLRKSDGAWHLVDSGKSRVVAAGPDKYLKVRTRDGCGKADEVVWLQEMFRRLRYAPRMATSDDVGLLGEGLFVVALSTTPKGEKKWFDCEIIKRVQTKSSHELHVKWHVSAQDAQNLPQTCVLNMDGPPCVQLTSNRDVGSHPKFKEWRAQLMEEKVGENVVDLTKPQIRHSPENPTGCSYASPLGVSPQVQAADTVRSNPAHLSPCLSRGEKEIVNLVDEDVAKDCRKKNKVIKLDPRHNKGIMDDVTDPRIVRSPGMVTAAVGQFQHHVHSGSFCQPRQGVAQSSGRLGDIYKRPAIHGPDPVDQKLAVANAVDFNTLARRGAGFNPKARTDLLCGDDRYQQPPEWVLPQRQLYPTPQAWMPCPPSARAIPPLYPVLAQNLRASGATFASMPGVIGSMSWPAPGMGPVTVLAQSPYGSTSNMARPKQDLPIQDKDKEEQTQVRAETRDPAVHDSHIAIDTTDASISSTNPSIAQKGTFRDVSRLGMLYLALCCFSDQQIDVSEEVKNIKVEGSLKRKKVTWNDF